MHSIWRYFTEPSKLLGKRKYTAGFTEKFE